MYFWVRHLWTAPKICISQEGNEIDIKETFKAGVYHDQCGNKDVSKAYANAACMYARLRHRGFCWSLWLSAFLLDQASKNFSTDFNAFVKIICSFVCFYSLSTFFNAIESGLPWRRFLAEFPYRSHLQGALCMPSIHLRLQILQRIRMTIYVSQLRNRTLNLPVGRTTLHSDIDSINIRGIVECR